MNINDSKLTAYVLDELDQAEQPAVARAIADSPEAQLFVADTQELARALRSQYQLELERELIAREKVIVIRDDSLWSKAGPLAIAAVLTVLAGIAAVTLSNSRSARVAALSTPASAREMPTARSTAGEFAPVEAEDVVQATQSVSRDADAGPFAYTGERPFVSARSKPRSSFPLFVDSGSYLNIRRSINAGVLPERDAVRVEEMINYFGYEYPLPPGQESLSVNVDVVTCPWESNHRLVRIGLTSREGIIGIEGSRIEVEFNPKRVGSYRLIGYDRQPSGRQSVNEKKGSVNRITGEYSFTGFYEVVPPSQTAVADKQIATAAGRPPERLLTAKLQLSTPTSNAVHSIERVVTDDRFGFADATQDLKFAAAVAEFGMILRDSEYKGNGTLEKVLEWAQEGKGVDVNGYRADFIELVRKAQALKSG